MARPAGKEVETGTQVGRWMGTDPGKVRTPVHHVLHQLPASESFRDLDMKLKDVWPQHSI